MNEKQKDIIAIFDTLSANDRNELYFILKGKCTPISTPEFAELIQRMYKKNIEIKYDKVSNGMRATICTPYGEFSEISDNKIEAKELALQKAFQEFNKQNIKQ